MLYRLSVISLCVFTYFESDIEIIGGKWKLFFSFNFFLFS